MTSIETKTLAAHVVVTLAHGQEDGRVYRLDELAAELGVRKADVRGVISQLHHEGHIDALRLRLTMSGLALATALENVDLHDPRHAHRPLRRVA